MELTQELVRRLFEYRDGELYWKTRPRSDFKTELAYLQWNPKHSGKRAGHLPAKHGSVAINKRHYPIHRVIFLWHHGYLPEIVDHADCDPANNKIENLRAATKADNQRNMRKPQNNSSGYKGVVWSKPCQKWMARIKYKGKHLHFGVFNDIEEAVACVKQQRERLHGAFANHG